MQKIHYLKIQNFKIFGEEITIHLDNPTVIIGANNSGKTSIIQALALWSWAIKTWFDKKKNSRSQAEKNKGVALNRLEIAQVPIKETRFFWNKTKIRYNSNDNIDLIIKVGFFLNNAVKEVGMIFKYHSPDLMYCQPTKDSFEDGLLEYASQLKVNILYPMSGISDREFVFQEEAIRTQIGVGQTASILRNICYHLFVNNRDNWQYLTDLMQKLFAIAIKQPFVRATGAIEVLYNYANKSQKTDHDLDITLAGRGQQQMLLVLAYLLSNKNAILMIDEPDAHLEILRQNQIFTALKRVAREYSCQIIIVTHSEVVLNESDKLVFLMDSNVHEISHKKEHKFIRDALQNFGIEHYYKAKINPHILYIEGSSDVSMLTAFARKAKHPALAILEGRLNYYYTQNESAQDDFGNEIKRKMGFYQRPKHHFNALQKIVPHLKAIGIFDGDNKNRQDEVQENYAFLYWEQYELENYFITPRTIIAFVQKTWQENKTMQGVFEELITSKLAVLQKVIDEELILPIFRYDLQAFNDFKNLPESLQNIQFQNFAFTHKISELLENVFQKFAEHEKEPILLSKGDFSSLIDFLETVPKEVVEKLDAIEKYLRP